MLGVIFPDIRRVSNVSREETHNRFKKLDLDFAGLSDFEAGWKFHVWCDLRRNEVLRDKRFYEIKEIGNAYYMSYYFLEDYLVWDVYRNWENLVYLYRNPSFIKTVEKARLHDWNFWFEIVSDYVRAKPTQESISNFVKHMPSVAVKNEKIQEEFEKLKKNARVAGILKNVYLEMV